MGSRIKTRDMPLNAKRRVHISIDFQLRILPLPKAKYYLRHFSAETEPINTSKQF